MKRDNKTFSEDFKKRIYRWILQAIKFLEALSKEDDVSRVIRHQLIRSATSVGANYVEAVAASSKKEFINFLGHSLKSANESKFWLALLRDTKKVEGANIEGLLKELIEISNILGASIRTMRSK